MTIIVSFFLFVREDLVGFIEFFEFCFFLFIAAMTIWMDFHSLFSVGFFDLIRTRCLDHSEDDIVFIGHGAMENIEDKREDTPDDILIWVYYLMCLEK